MLALLGCLATQGGPVWWASKHRAHHKFCDKPRDPHSAKLRGLIGAFAWFGKARRRPTDPAPPCRRIAIAHPSTRPRAHSPTRHRISRLLASRSTSISTSSSARCTCAGSY